jgi:hypothetical protein
MEGATFGKGKSLERCIVSCSNRRELVTAHAQMRQLCNRSAKPSTRSPRKRMLCQKCCGLNYRRNHWYLSASKLPRRNHNIQFSNKRDLPNRDLAALTRVDAISSILDASSCSLSPPFRSKVSATALSRARIIDNSGAKKTGRAVER